MNLGNTIKELRLKKGIKQTEFAQICSITQSYLSNIERDRKEPTISLMHEISKNLGIPFPIIFFLAMDENDVSEDKKLHFQTMAPLLKNTLIQAFAK
jgi:XRE family transcriptional regulator, regulator of sulfur utilization